MSKGGNGGRGSYAVSYDPAADLAWFMESELSAADADINAGLGYLLSVDPDFLKRLASKILAQQYGGDVAGSSILPAGPSGPTPSPKP